MLGLGGLALPDLLRLRASGGGAEPRPAERHPVLAQRRAGPHGDLGPQARRPGGFRGPFGAIATSVPGVHFGELLPEQARRMDRLAILRTVNHGTGDHTKGNHWMLTGYEGPAFNAPDNTDPAPARRWARPWPGCKAPGGPGMPPYVAVPNLRGGTDNLFHYAAYLGGGANPFVVESDPNDPKFRVKNLTLPERRVARPPGGSPPRARRRWTRSAARPTRSSATSTPITSAPSRCSPARSVAAAFDIAAEDPRLRDRYGRHTFGQSALLARRLVEAGTPFVTVNCVPWDHHGTAPQLKTEEGAKKLIPPLDRAIAALIDDLIERGLYDSTLVVAMGEFGRTPRMNKDAGRDHWGNTFSVLMGCGSMRMGQVIGRSSERGEHVVDRPISPQDVAATVYHHLGIDARSVTFEDRTGRPTYLIEKGEPIRELIG